ncbi:glycosyltransferase, partial [Myxococcota bacterium]|nr:glycosyltransferase [Myxococcota bacterium]
MNDKRIVVVIPTYNEAENVRNIVPQVLTALPGADVLIVDDSSPDGTGDIVKEMALGEPRIGLLSRRGKEG